MSQETNALKSDTSSELARTFDSQMIYTLNRADNDGSVAIALGRTAGLAKMLGLEATATHFWKQLEQLQPEVKDIADMHMPGLNEFYAGYTANKAAFSRFASKNDFPAGGADFSNAAGCYAFALDYMRRGDNAIVNGGEAVWIYDWAAKALHAAGFDLQAGMLDKKRDAVQKTMAHDFASVVRTDTGRSVTR